MHRSLYPPAPPLYYAQCTKCAEMHFPLPTYCSLTASTLPRKQSVHNAANTTSMHTPEKQEHCTSTLPPHVVFLHCNSPPWCTTISLPAMWNPPACSYLCWFVLGRGRKGSRYSDICAGAICTTQHTDTHGLTTCVCTHTHRYLYKHIATCITHTAQQHAHKTETHGRTNNKKPESSHKQPQCLNTPRNSHSHDVNTPNQLKTPRNQKITLFSVNPPSP